VKKIVTTCESIDDFESLISKLSDDFKKVLSHKLVTKTDRKSDSSLYPTHSKTIVKLVLTPPSPHRDDWTFTIEQSNEDWNIANQYESAAKEAEDLNKKLFDFNTRFYAQRTTFDAVFDRETKRIRGE
jgi:hypothetical protein